MEQSTGKSAAMSEPKLNGHDRKAGRKPRIPLSCGACRYRKLKCNRQQPCQNCIVRKEPGACIFAGPDARPTSISKVHVENMQGQIDRLENLVTSLLSKKNSDGDLGVSRGIIPSQSGTSAGIHAHPSPALTTDIADPDKIKNGQGMLKVDDDHSVYVGPSHWSDVLHELNELKTSWNQVQEEQVELALSASFASSTIDGPSFLCGIVSPIGISELLATLPAKPVADSLITRFFDENDTLVPSLHILHKPTFLKQYEDHWKSPSETKIMWLGLLFSILGLSMASYGLPKSEPPEYQGVSKHLSELYRLRTAQCLMMADITKCLPYTVETLIYNALAEQVGKKDSSAGVWVMCGVIVRVALQMGYHRDPALYPNIPIFQGEMRRRVWYSILTLDAVSSFMVGLPSMIRSLDHDSLEPRNIHDWEIHEGIAELPPSRPPSEITPVSYLVAKARLLRPLGAVVDFVSSLQRDSYDLALKVDEKLTSAYFEMPSHLQMKDIGQTVGYSPSTVNRMVQIEFLFHQGVCVLHRRFLVEGRRDNRFARSHEQSMKSAMALLNHQNILYEVAKKTGSMKAQYWFQVSFMSHGFILPAVIVCLNLRYRKKEFANGDDSNSSDRDHREEDMLDALKTAQKIWKEAQDLSPETWKIYRVLSQLLESVGICEKDTCSMPEKQGPSLSTQDNDLTSQIGVSFADQAIGASTEMDIDWSAWDSFIEGSSFDDVYGAMQFNGDDIYEVNTGDVFYKE